MAKHDVLNVTYLRKDSQFFADGIWYVTSPCPIHGNIDEEVSWEEAKTPHHAGLIADQRHAACVDTVNQNDLRIAGLLEIKAAEDMLYNQEHNLQNARNALALLDPADVDYAPALARVKRHENGLVQAQQRVKDIIKANRG